MSKISIVIPTVEGREEYLERCCFAYEHTLEGHEAEFIIIKDKPTCGIAWQQGAEAASGDFLHFTADDLVPYPGWLGKMLEVVQTRGGVPVALVVVPQAESLDEHGFPRPLSLAEHLELAPQANYFESQGGPELIPDWFQAQLEMSEYASIPFCSMTQWEQIGPMIATHYGTDKWFSARAVNAGYPLLVRHDCAFFHYSAQPGRIPKGHGWHHVDLLTYDMNIAYPMYASGQLPPTALPPARLQPEGRAQAREWYRAALDPPWPWDDPDLPPEYRD